MNSKIQVQKCDFTEKDLSLVHETIKTKEILPPQASGEEEFNLMVIKDIQNIIKRCSHLSEQEKLKYCESQRYFIKQYLKQINQNHNF